jgi:hypothetical protein
MSALTAGNWIAFQSESQKANVTKSPLPHWSVGIEHENNLCHGVGASGTYMLVSGICSEADAKAMAASKDLLELAYQYQSDLRHPPTADSVTRRLERIAAVLAKVGA